MRVLRAALIIFLAEELLSFLSVWLPPPQRLPSASHTTVAAFHSAVLIFAGAGAGAGLFRGLARLGATSRYARLLGLILGLPVGAVVGAGLGVAMYPVWEALVQWPGRPEGYQLVFGGAFWGGLIGMLFGAGLGQPSSGPRREEPWKSGD